VPEAASSAWPGSTSHHGADFGDGLGSPRLPVISDELTLHKCYFFLILGSLCGTNVVMASLQCGSKCDFVCVCVCVCVCVILLKIDLQRVRI
jgi:hypothetical protein